MRIIFKVRLKVFGAVFLLLCSSLLLFTLTDVKSYLDRPSKGLLQLVPGKGRKVASINSEDLESVWPLKQSTALSNSSHEPDRGLNDAANIARISCVGPTCNSVTSTIITSSKISSESKQIKGYNTTTSQLFPSLDNSLYLDDIVRISKNFQPLSQKGVNLENLNQRINKIIQQQVLNKFPTKSKFFNPSAINFQGLPMKDTPCDSTKEICRIRKLPILPKFSRGGRYADRVKIEPITLPSEWSASPDLSRKLQERKERVQQVCQAHGLDQRTSLYQPNSWEFLIDKDHGLIWCNIFKSASSTWFYNFNILAGYSESHLLSAKETPITLARKKYPRPSVEELDAAVNADPHPLTFMIARHPLERLVSAYRDKLQSGTRFYRNVASKIMKAYPDLGPKKQLQYVTVSPKERSLLPSGRGRKYSLKYVSPSFSQFVQYIIDNADDGIPLDEHWAPMVNFCTPCLVDFDVYAKVESLAEDGNYIIFSSGIENIIKPKRINMASNEPTNTVAKSFLCQLNADQQERLVKLYAIDMELFDYKYDHLLNCTITAR